MGITQPRDHSLADPYMYSVTGQDVAQEIEKWEESAALASADHSAHFHYGFCATSCLVTQYLVHFPN